MPRKQGEADSTTMLNGMTPVPYIRIVEVREGARSFSHSPFLLRRTALFTVRNLGILYGCVVYECGDVLTYTPFSRIHVHAASQAPVGMPANIALSTRIASADASVSTVPLSGNLTGTGQTGMNEAGLPNASQLVAPPTWLVPASSLYSSQDLSAAATTSNKHPTSQPASLPPQTTMGVTRVAGRKRRASQRITEEDIEALIDDYDLKGAALELNVW